MKKPETELKRIIPPEDEPHVGVDTSMVNPRNRSMGKLFEILKDIPTIKKDATANIKTKAGGEFSYNYSDINSILEVINPILHKHGTFIIQPVRIGDQGDYIHSELIDADTGEVILYSDMLLPYCDDPKAQGGLITYFRRYCIVAMLSLEAEDNEENLPARTTPNQKFPTKIDSNSIFIATKYIAEKSARDSQLRQLKAIGAKWLKDKEMWIGSIDKLAEYQKLEIVKEIKNVKGEIIK